MLVIIDEQSMFTFLFFVIVLPTHFFKYIDESTFIGNLKNSEFQKKRQHSPYEYFRTFLIKINTLNTVKLTA